MSATATPSIFRTIANVKKNGIGAFWRQLNYIGDSKSGELKGVDEHGNKYYENTKETLWRHRWVDFSSHDFNATQVPPEWHSWLTHIRFLPPDVDPVIIASRQPWQVPHFENITGTRGAYKSYSTTTKKVAEWEGKPITR